MPGGSRISALDGVFWRQVAAGIDRVLAEHRALDTQVGELETFLDAPRPTIGKVGFHTWAADLSGRLVRLHDELFRHFRFEEQSGMERDIASYNFV